MTRDYWEQRRDEIYAFRDYARSFDLYHDRMAETWLAESGHQLMEIAFQLMFLDCEEDAINIAKRALEYYEASLASESDCPETDPRMASVFQRLYYARWWTTGEEPAHLITRAAEAFCTGLVRAPSPENAALYQRAALLWLEAGEADQAKPWISLFQQSALPEAASTPITTMLKTIPNNITDQGLRQLLCSKLPEALRLATQWGQQSAGTLWDALQLANVHRRWCGGSGDFRALLLQIR